MTTPAIDHRLASLTPDTLTEIVERAGGSVSARWDSITEPADGGDGVSGHTLLTLVDSDGDQVGEVGFFRTGAVNEDTVTYTVSDYTDSRVDGTPTWVSVNQRGLLAILAAFASPNA